MTKGQLKLLQKECWEEKMMASIAAGKMDDCKDFPDMMGSDHSGSGSDESSCSDSDSESATSTPKKGKKASKKKDKKHAKSKQSKKNKKTKNAKKGSPASSRSSPNKRLEVEEPTEATWYHSL